MKVEQSSVVSKSNFGVSSVVVGVNNKKNIKKSFKKNIIGFNFDKFDSDMTMMMRGTTMTRNLFQRPFEEEYPSAWIAFAAALAVLALLLLLSSTISRELNGELISRSKCKRQASLLSSPWKTQLLSQNLTEDRTQTQSQTSLAASKEQHRQIQIQYFSHKEPSQRVVFLPGPEPTDTSWSADELIASAQDETSALTLSFEPNTWLDLDLSSAIDEFPAAPAQPVPHLQSHQGELLNTPVIDGYKRFNFTESESNSKGVETRTNEDSKINYNSIQELLQDEQMFKFDSDSIFDSMDIGEYNSNQDILGLEHIKDSQEHFIPEPADIYADMPETFYQSQKMTDEMECAPATVKLENDFDLIEFVMGNDNYQNLTPLEEKSEPIFEIKPEPQVVEVVKDEPSPSTSKAASPIPEHRMVIAASNVRSSSRRAPKRRYSSESEFSISTSASSFNATSKRQKKRGRPAKELITDLPTVEDFDLPREEASHLVNRIKNNEASRKSRMKSKSKQDAMEDECDRLLRRRRVLEVKKNKYEGQIETLRRWLLGQN